MKTKTRRILRPWTRVEVFPDDFGTDMTVQSDADKYGMINVLKRVKDGLPLYPGTVHSHVAGETSDNSCANFHEDLVDYRDFLQRISDEFGDDFDAAAKFITDSYTKFKESNDRKQTQQSNSTESEPSQSDNNASASGSGSQRDGRNSSNLSSSPVSSTK